MIVTYNKTKNSWSNDQEDTPFHIFQFNFVEDGKDLVEFDNLSFGTTVTHIDSGKKFTVQFPPEGVQYVSTEEGIVEVFEIEDVVNNESYSAVFWCENGGKRSEHSFDFTVRRLPTKPYNSWTWNDTEKMWEPPTEHPQDDGNIYYWDEDSLSWKIFEDFVEPTEDRTDYKDTLATATTE